MAWREKKSLTCPQCRRKEPIVWVLGRSLKRSDATKGYIRAHNAGGWLIQKNETEQVVMCPDCGVEVKRRGLYPDPRPKSGAAAT